MTTYKYKSFSSFCWPACSWHLPLPINHMFLMLYFVESKQPFISSFFSCFPRCESRCRSLTAINSSFDDEEQHEGSRGGHFGNAKVAGAFFGLSFMAFKGSRMSLNAEDSGNKSKIPSHFWWFQSSKIWILRQMQQEWKVEAKNQEEGPKLHLQQMMKMHHP